MSIRRRLEALESSKSSCPECGIGPDSPIEYEVDWGDREPGAPVESPPPCPRCGRRKALIRVAWDDASIETDEPKGAA